MAQKKDSKAQIKVMQTGSTIGCPDDQKATLVGLGLRKIGNVRVLQDTASVRGMVRKVKHLVNVENV
jgi:large subunit ribosomal protein L30